MKQETKELIEGLKNWFEDFRSNAVLTDYTKWAIGNGEGYADEGASNMDKIINLLDSLESLENQLKLGGFIPDRNGKPCKDGDKIEICRDGIRSGEIIHGHLVWDSTTFGFHAVEDDTNEFLYIDSNTGEVQWFEREV